MLYVLFHPQEPVWKEIGTHIGTSCGGIDPTNIPDGFFYVPLLDTLKALLSNMRTDIIASLGINKMT